MSQPSVMNPSYHFAQVPQAEIQRSSFDRSHGYKTIFDAGYLIPIFVDEVLPGDTFNLKLNALLVWLRRLSRLWTTCSLTRFSFCSQSSCLDSLGQF